ncbi:MAG: hypothetical protein ACI867_001452, partial [Glaciecola sp.]
MTTRFLSACAPVVVAALLAAVVTSRPASAQSTTPSGPVPTVDGPIGSDVGIQGHPLWDSWFALAPFGYEQAEYFVSGTASADDGSSTAEFTTRILVARPIDAEDFHGTVMLDWVNVTAQFENAVNSVTATPFLLREGWAYVHVSAQAAGLCCTPFLTPQTWDPVRYASMNHPGDAYAHDIFTQVARIFAHPTEVVALGGTDPMDGLDLEVIVASGQSQGGSRMSSYLQAAQPTAQVIDAFLQQAGGTKNYEAAPTAPVIHLLGDREGSVADPTPWPTYRLWEIAGSAHQDLWIGRQQTEGQSVRLATTRQQTRAQAEALWLSAGNYGEQPDPRFNACVVNGAAFPTRYAVDAALWHLDNWVRTGTAPPQGDRFEFDGTALAKDDLENTLGGVRYAPLEVPIARYIADSCNLGGITVPLTEPELLARYASHADYYGALVTEVEADVAERFLLVEDAMDLLTRACAARNRWGELTASGPCEPEAVLAFGGAAEPTTTPVGETVSAGPESAPASL